MTKHKNVVITNNQTNTNEIPNILDNNDCNIYKVLRICSNLTVEEFSERMDISKNYIYAIERNEKYPSMKTIEKYCKAFHIDNSVFAALLLQKNQTFFNILAQVVNIIRTDTI